MWIDVEHRMRFEYDAFIQQSRLELRVRPRTNDQQTLHSFSLAVGPPARVHRYVDWNDNAVHHFSVSDWHDRIETTARSLVHVHPVEIDGGHEPPPPREALGELLDFVRFDGPVAHAPALNELDAELPVAADAPVREQALAVRSLVHRRLVYQAEVTDWRSTTHDVLETGAGVCQDFAHLMLALLRRRGIPCRYVSGYLHVESDDASQSHAWVEVFGGSGRWLAHDPTQDCVPGERHVQVAVGRHYDDVPPNRGFFRGEANETMHASVHTRTAQKRDLVGMHEELGQIDLPVHRELPPRRPAARLEAEQQQEQQQQ